MGKCVTTELESDKIRTHTYALALKGKGKNQPGKRQESDTERERNREEKERQKEHRKTTGRFKSIDLNSCIESLIRNEWKYLIMPEYKHTKIYRACS